MIRVETSKSPAKRDSKIHWETGPLQMFRNLWWMRSKLKYDCSVVHSKAVAVNLHAGII
jgi:hypothetical protein